MKKQTKAKGRRPEMNITLGIKTVQRYDALYAEGDYAEINRMISHPPTTPVTVGKHLQAASNAANEQTDYVMPLSIAKAAQAFYAKKEKEVKALAE